MPWASRQTLAETWGMGNVPISPACLQGFASAGGPVGLRMRLDKAAPLKGQGTWLSQVVQMQCDHLKGRWVSHMLWDVYHGRDPVSTPQHHPWVFSSPRATNPAWAPS